MHGKTTPVIDLVLDASPENSEVTLQIEYQTEIITALRIIYWQPIFY
ncbi:hypothetical protein DOY81_009052 [Sarcophaga bullata]|nr:hypothetical protein DOY81_009052 [Sarcophaga bullata]